MTARDVFDFLNYLGRKDPMGNITSEDNFNNLIPVAANIYLSNIMGVSENYSPRKPNINYGLGKNQFVENKILPLITNEDINLDVNGQVAYSDLSANYYHPYSFSYEYSPGYEVPVVMLNSSEFDDWKSSPNLGEDEENPFCTFRGSYIQFAPADIYGETINFTYIKRPRVPSMGYAIDYATAESVYLDNAAYIIVTNAGTSGNTIELSTSTDNLGSYEVQSGDSASDVMKRLAAAINENRYVHGCHAIYDDSKLWINVESGSQSGSLTIDITGTIATDDDDFSTRSTQFDWEDQVDCMFEIIEILLGMVGISIKNNLIAQWSEMQQQK